MLKTILFFTICALLLTVAAIHAFVYVMTRSEGAWDEKDRRTWK